MKNPKVDPLEKIKKWKPDETKLRDPEKELPYDGKLTEQCLLIAKEKEIDADFDWEEFKRLRWSFFSDENNQLIRDCKNILYHQHTREEMKMVYFLLAMLGRSRQQLGPFRNFDNLSEPKKMESMFRNEAEKSQQKKLR